MSHHMLSFGLAPALTAFTALVLSACEPTTSPGTEGAIEAPARTWTWVPFAQTRCGNGAATGLGISPAPGSRTLVLYLQGGGACTDGATCFGIAPSAANMANGYGPNEFALEPNVRGGIVFLDRSRADNPFRDAHHVFVPYCTGDVHAGDAEADYEAFGQRRTAHHRGFANLGHFLERIAPTFPDVDRVILAGASAGGFGALFNAPRVQAAFDGARVDVLSDSGPPIAVPAELIASWRRTWNLQLPADCSACVDAPERLMEFHLERHPNSHWALLAATRDGVLSHFSGMSEDEMAAAVDRMLERIAPLPTVRAFVVPGTRHVVISDPFARVDDVTLSDWLSGFASDDPSWRTARP